MSELLDSISHALTSIATLRRANEGKEIAIDLGYIEKALDDAWSALNNLDRSS
jgi:hypothetical protein